MIKPVKCDQVYHKAFRTLLESITPTVFDHITKRMVPYTLTISIFAWRALYKDIGKYSKVYASYRHFSKIPVVYGFRGIRMLQCKIICPWVGFFVFGFWNASPLRCHLHHILVSCHFQARYLIFTLLYGIMIFFMII